MFCKPGIQVRAIKKVVRVPILSNGNIKSWASGLKDV